jgi:NDP-sugar pyrophosphorylase family protein
LNHEIIRSIPKDKKVSLENNIFPRLIGRGLYGYKSQGAFIDIGIPEDFGKAEQFFYTECNRINPSRLNGNRN